MRIHLLHRDAGQRTFAVVFAAGDSVVDGLRSFAAQEGLSSAGFTGIGAFERVTLGYFDLADREYRRIEIAEQVELLALVGNVAAGDDGPQLHGHVVVGRGDGSAHGGHLLDARVRPTLEVIATELPGHLTRSRDPATGLLLIDLPAADPRSGRDLGTARPR